VVVSPRYAMGGLIVSDNKVDGGLGEGVAVFSFQLVDVFPSSSFLAFSMILWERALLNVSSSGAVGLGL